MLTGCAAPTVQPATAETDIPPVDRYAALTFDDGPSPTCTPILLDGLRERGVHATFFLIGSKIDGQEELVRRMQAEGHQIGNHSYDHAMLQKTDTASALRDLARCDAALQQLLDKQGQVLLYSVAWPPQGIYTKKPVNSAADLKGMKWRVYSPTTARIGELVGAQPVTIQEAELSQALATGVIEGLITSSATGADNKLFENLKHYYNVQAWIPKNAVTVSKKAFNALSKEEQEAVLKAATEAEERGWKASREVDAKSIETLKAGGMIVEEGSPELKADLVKVGEVVIKEWLEKAGKDGQAILDTYKTGK